MLTLQVEGMEIIITIIITTTIAGATMEAVFVMCSVAMTTIHLTQIIIRAVLQLQAAATVAVVAPALPAVRP
jgi:hypothetical protein